MPYPNSGAGRPGLARDGGSGERAAIDALARRLPPAPPGQRWIGDDAAAVPAEPGTLLLTVDSAVMGVHADPAFLTVEDLGWRAVAGAVSDVAAMGGEVRHLLVAVAGPPSTDLGLLYDGIEAAAEHHGAPIVGGDLSTAPCLSVCVTVTGLVPAAEVGAAPAVGRDGARPGDHLLVTGPLGASAAGLRMLRAGTVSATTGAASATTGEGAAVTAHRRPVARLAEGARARRSGVSAMIDVSDGLGIDLARLADASRVGFALDLIPVAPGATSGEALGGGEDYELVMATAEPAPVVRAMVDAGLRRPLAIGRVVADPAIRTLEGRPLPAAGWEHPWR